VEQSHDAETHGDEEHGLQKLQDANCDEPAIAVWMGMRCQSAVIKNPAFKPMIHPTTGRVADTVAAWTPVPSIRASLTRGDGKKW
jgi:hypothetical protein